jgi:tight adherence protein B
MVRARAAVAVLVAAVAFVAATAVPAWADAARSVQLVSHDGRTLNFVVYLDPQAPGVDNGASADSTVTVSGVEVPSQASDVVKDTHPKQAILVLDVSGSMRGPRLAAAKEAAKNYVSSMPADVEIGLFSFNDTVSLDVAPTKDKQAVSTAIDALQAGRKTALYDGMIAGLDKADVSKGARILVLSDGGDSASAATIDDVNKRAADLGIPMDIVALTPTANHAALLKSMATVTGGQFLLATDVSGLNDAFHQATGSFGGKVEITATLPDNVDGAGRFAIVDVSVGGTDFKGTTQLPSDPALAATTTSGASAAPVVPGVTETPQSDVSAPVSVWTWLFAGLAAVIVVLGALAFAQYRRQQKARLRTEQVLWYTSAVETGNVGVRPDLSQDGALKNIDAWMAEKSFYPAVDTKLDNAGVRISVATWIAIRIMATVVLVLLLSLIIGNVLIGLLIGAAIGWLVSGAWLNSREAARRKSFNDELPDFLLLMASSLRSGLSFQQALDSAAAEGVGEVSRQMRRALREVQMGSTIEAALLRVSDRMDSEDLKWTVTALAIQREVGGNLSNILETAANTVKGRAELRREVRTLSAEGRLSGWVLAALPVGLFFYMVFANRDYVSFFWSTTMGYILLAGILVLFIGGFIWMRRLVRIEV